MPGFERALAFTLRWEGGLSQDPDDPGGTTKYGISARAHPEVDVRNLTLEDAKEIYRKEYWER
jgi:lysozyme family protein